MMTTTHKKTNSHNHHHHMSNNMIMTEPTPTTEAATSPTSTLAAASSFNLFFPIMFFQSINATQGKIAEPRENVASLSNSGFYLIVLNILLTILIIYAIHLRNETKAKDSLLLDRFIGCLVFSCGVSWYFGLYE